MKKIFTLLVSVGLLTAAANAQTSPRDNRQYDPRNDQRNLPPVDQRDTRQYDPRNDQQNSQWDKDNRYDNDGNIRYNNRQDRNSGYYGRGIERQVAQINRKFDFQVQRVRNNFFMRRSEKMRTIRSLEYQRQQEIRMLYARADRDRDSYHDRDDDSRRRY